MSQAQAQAQAGLAEPIIRLFGARPWSRSLPWRRAQVVTCAEVAEALPEILDGGQAAPAHMVAHVERCLGCQAELARYRRLVRLLHQLRTSEDVPPPPGVMAGVLSVLEDTANRHVVRSLLTGRSLMYGGAAVAASAATVGLVVLARAHSGSGSRADGAAHEVLS